MNLLRVAPAIVLAGGLAGGLAGCVTTDDPNSPTQLRISLLEQQVSTLEAQLRGFGNADVLGQLEGVEKRERDVRGELEKVGYDLESAAKRQRQLYRDLDQRLQSLETSGRANPSNEAPVTAAGSYQNAFNQLKRGEIDNAIEGFQSFIAANPGNDLLGNAHYWLGESHYVKRQYAKAGTEFAAVVNQHSNSTKVKDALLKLGYVKFEQGQFASARETLQTVVIDFPGTTVASLAAQRLGVMNKNGQ